ncbi:MAG: sulfotransferase, partial [Xanthomonadales bacterium]|nr:sulfotransferase [Xanthomonadales bacterium]
YIPEIERHVPGVRFVHVVRHGLDVLASIADANMHYDDNHDFGGGMKLWANRWNRAIAIHRCYIGRPNHHIVFLDDFAHDTAGEWRRLCEALSLDPDMPLDEACGQSIADLADEPWKRQAIDGRLRPPRSKAQALFGPETLSWLSQRLVTLDPLREQRHARARIAYGYAGNPAAEA